MCISRTHTHTPQHTRITHTHKPAMAAAGCEHTLVHTAHIPYETHTGHITLTMIPLRFTSIYANASHKTQTGKESYMIFSFLLFELFMNFIIVHIFFHSIAISMRIIMHLHLAQPCHKFAKLTFTRQTSPFVLSGFTSQQREKSVFINCSGLDHARMHHITNHHIWQLPFHFVRECSV